MHCFRERLQLALDSSTHNRRTLSLAAGLGERTIANILGNKELDTSPTGPGLFAMARVCEELGISMDWLAGREEAMRGLKSAEKELAMTIQRFKSAIPTETDSGAILSPNYMMRLFVRSGGMLEAFEDLLSYCDRYEPPKSIDDPIKVLAQGSNALSAITMGGSNPDVLQMALNSASDGALRKKLVSDHIEASKRGCLTTVESLDVQMPNRPIKIKMDYTRVILNLKTKTGKKENVLYASLIL